MSKTPKADQVANILHSDAASGLRRVLGIFMPDELAASLAVSEQTVHAWRRAGEGPQHTRLGRRVYYREQDIKEWIVANVGREAAEAEQDEIENDEVPLVPCAHEWVEQTAVGTFKCSKCGAKGTAK